MKCLHIYGISHDNAGDNLLGPASKWWLEETIFNNQYNCTWVSKSCRDPYNDDTVDYINTFDTLLIGGGGLFLPDTNPNKQSCWQWGISTALLRKINIPIYVCAIGYNLFYNQAVTMPNRDNSITDMSRYDIFKTSIETLIEMAELFTVRHRGDIKKIEEIISSDLHHKVKFQFCPTVEYSKKLSRKKEPVKSDDKQIWAYEIKDDRKWRRYFKVGEQNFYSQLHRFIKHIRDTKPNVEQHILLHESPNMSFLNYMRAEKDDLPIIRNCNIPPAKTVENLNSIDVLFAMAGHSQMVGQSVSGRVISLITHDKLKYFLQDIGLYTYSNYVDVNHDDIYSKLTNIIK